MVTHPSRGDHRMNLRGAMDPKYGNLAVLAKLRRSVCMAFYLLVDLRPGGEEALVIKDVFCRRGGEEGFPCRDDVEFGCSPCYFPINSWD